MIRAIRIRLYPTPDQKKYLAGLFGTEKTGQIFLLVGRRIESNADGADHS